MPAVIHSLMEDSDDSGLAAFQNPVEDNMSSRVKATTSRAHFIVGTSCRFRFLGNVFDGLDEVVIICVGLFLRPGFGGVVPDFAEIFRCLF